MSSWWVFVGKLQSRCQPVGYYNNQSNSVKSSIPLCDQFHPVTKNNHWSVCTTRFFRGFHQLVVFLFFFYLFINKIPTQPGFQVRWVELKMCCQQTACHWLVREWHHWISHESASFTTFETPSIHPDIHPYFWNPAMKMAAHNQQVHHHMVRIPSVTMLFVSHDVMGILGRVAITTPPTQRW